jgi:hypothetical protein
MLTRSSQDFKVTSSIGQDIELKMGVRLEVLFGVFRLNRNRTNSGTA